MLERYAATNYGPFYQRHAAGLAAVIIGGISLIVAFWLQFNSSHEITSATALPLTLPLLALALAAGIVSFARREKLRPLPIAGMALAAAAPVVGWVILVSIVGIVAIVAILIIAKLT